MSGSSRQSMPQAAITWPANSIPFFAMGLLPTLTICQVCMAVSAGIVVPLICASGHTQLTSPTSEETKPCRSGG